MLQALEAGTMTAQELLQASGEEAAAVQGRAACSVLNTAVVKAQQLLTAALPTATVG
jgi:hypothetical protein